MFSEEHMNGCERLLFRLFCQSLEKARHATQRDRWRARMKPNSGLTFAHAMLFSAFSAMIGTQHMNEPTT